MHAPRWIALAISVLLSVGLVACGGDDEEPEEPAQTAPSDQAGGEEAAAGRMIFEQQGCGSCHTLAAADTTGTIGPNLDQTLPGQSESEIRESIVDPNAEIVEGYGSGTMPTDFGEKLNDRQLNQLVEFLSQSAGG